MQLTNLCAAEAPFILGELKTFLAIYRNRRAKSDFLIKLDTFKLGKGT
jgi:hypothetical protein